MTTTSPPSTTDATHVCIARPDDLAALVSIRHEPREQVSSLLRDPDRRLLLATQGTVPVASALIGTDTFATVITDIVCLQPRRDLTEQLVGAAVSLAMAWHSRSVSWRIPANDLESLSIAVARGFHVTGVIAVGAPSGVLVLTAQRFLTLERPLGGYAS